MEITRVDVTLNDGQTCLRHKNERILAFCQIIIDNCFCVTGIRIVKGKNRLFVAMPSCVEGTEQAKDGKTVVQWHDIVFPVDRITRNKVEGAIMEAYQRQLEQLNSKEHREVVECEKDS